MAISLQSSIRDLSGTNTTRSLCPPEAATLLLAKKVEKYRITGMPNLSLKRTRARPGAFGGGLCKLSGGVARAA
jgi:hypothetical protein